MSAAQAKQTSGRKRAIYMALAPVTVLLVAGWIYFTGGQYEETDNAYVIANMVHISPQVSGRILEATAQQNQTVNTGDILFRIDPAPYQAALNQAEATLNQVRAEIEAEKASYREKQAEITRNENTLKYTQREYERQKALAKGNVVSQSKLDSVQHDWQVAQQNLAISREDLARIRADLGGDPETATDENPKVKAAQAACDQAALNLEYTAVKAPFHGTVTETPQPGQVAQPGVPVVVFVADRDLWIEANFKETQLTYVRPGQPVKVWIDAYPGKIWQGVVESISGATGTQTSVLPAQNASGNWVKVVQRIPVRIRLDQQSEAAPLRGGMSAQVEVDTGTGHTPLGRLFHR